jgi:hypothetical protein
MGFFQDSSQCSYYFLVESTIYLSSPLPGLSIILKYWFSLACFFWPLWVFEENECFLIKLSKIFLESYWSRKVCIMKSNIKHFVNCLLFLLIINSVLRVNLILEMQWEYKLVSYIESNCWISLLSTYLYLVSSNVKG